jgi:hypothetical protein
MPTLYTQYPLREWKFEGVKKQKISRPGAKISHGQLLCLLYVLRGFAPWREMLLLVF